MGIVIAFVVGVVAGGAVVYIYKNKIQKQVDEARAKAPCKMILRAIRFPKETIEIWNDGNQTRSFLYIDDCCEALYVLSKNYNKIRKKNIDLTSFKWYTIESVIKIISNYTKCTYSFSNKKEDNRICYEPNKYILKYWIEGLMIMRLLRISQGQGK